MLRLIPQTRDKIQSRLFSLAAVFLALYSLALSLSPSVEARSWEAPFLWQHWLGFAAWLVMMALVHRQSTRCLPERDPYLLPVAGLLTGWGLLTIWRLFPDFGMRQTAWLIISSGVLIAGMYYNGILGFLKRYKYVWLTGGLVLTTLTIFFGTNPMGAGPRMWLGCCGIYLQPSEPLKLLLVVYLAAYLAGEMGEGMGRLRLPPSLSSSNLLSLLAPTLVMTGLALALLVVQKDLGTASIFIFLYTAIVYVTSGRSRTLLVGGLGTVLAAVAGYLLFDVVRVRMDAWLNPWLDPSGRSYQIVQSLIAVASGGIAGRGPGLGSPRVVPVPHSDFIFASIAEETGLVGVIGLLLLLAILAQRGMHIALNAPGAYRRYLAAGLTTYLVAQSVLIIGGNLRLLPLTGVTLPFVSYGGSSLLTAIISLLLLVICSNTGDLQPATLVRPRAYFQLTALLFAGLAAAGLIAGWWAVVRAPDLLARTDNPRRAIADRYVRRGSLLDRRNQPISQSVGTPGAYTRQVDYPSLSPVAGYTNPIFGQSGLEASLDSFLRGLSGYDGLTLWWNALVYGQPPPGEDIRLSLDLRAQARADELLGNQTGAIVLLDPASGEILALASHPTFDANQLEQSWESLVADPRSPLLNRTTQGLYPPGAALSPLFLGYAMSYSAVPALPEELSLQVDGQRWTCAASPEGSSWPAAIQSGCPAPAAALGEALGAADVREIFNDLGLFLAPQVRLPGAASPLPPADLPAQELALGSGLQVTPLQMALAASVLSNDGTLPAPRLVLAVNFPEQGWTALDPLAPPSEVLPAPQANQVARSLAGEAGTYWQVTAVAPNGPERHVTWFLGGTLPDEEVQPLVAVVLLEQDDPARAREIGQQLLQTGSIQLSRLPGSHPAQQGN